MRGTLPRRRIGREPASRLLVHPGEVLRVAEDEGRAHDLLDRAPRGAKDGIAVAKDLPGLLLDGRTDDGPGGGIEGALAADEDEPAGDDSLAVRKRAVRRRPGASGVLTIVFATSKSSSGAVPPQDYLRSGSEGGLPSADAVLEHDPAGMRS